MDVHSPVRGLSEVVRRLEVIILPPSSRPKQRCGFIEVQDLIIPVGIITMIVIEYSRAVDEALTSGNVRRSRHVQVHETGLEVEIHRSIESLVNKTVEVGPVQGHVVHM